MYNKMSSSDAEALKRRILKELSMRGNTVQRPAGAAPVIRDAQTGKASLDPREFHPESKVYGSTGVYRDMKGGSHFNEYDCGHEYNDSVIRDEKNKAAANVKCEQIRAAFADKEQVRTAFVMSEIFSRRGRHRARYSERF